MQSHFVGCVVHEMSVLEKILAGLHRESMISLRYAFLASCFCAPILDLSSGLVCLAGVRDISAVSSLLMLNGLGFMSCAP